MPPCVVCAPGAHAMCLFKWVNGAQRAASILWENTAVTATSYRESYRYKAGNTTTCPGPYCCEPLPQNSLGKTLAGLSYRHRIVSMAYAAELAYITDSFWVFLSCPPVQPCIHSTPYTTWRVMAEAAGDAEELPRPTRHAQQTPSIALPPHSLNIEASSQRVHSPLMSLPVGVL